MNKLSAIFVDIENVYFYIAKTVRTPNDASEVTVDLVRKTREHVETAHQANCIMSHAYADFERLGGGIQGPLYLAAVETHNVLSTEHKNAADMRLCIDALETLYTRKEVEIYVFIAGDRDYIPVIQHLKQHAKEVLVVAFQDTLSGDLRQLVGSRGYLDALELVGDVVDPALAVISRTYHEAAKVGPVPKQPPIAAKKKPTMSIRAELTPDEHSAVEVLMQDFSQHHEVWLTPYLRKLRESEQLALLAEYERKALISSLAMAGVYTIEKKPGKHPQSGEEVEYSVLTINWDHPVVHELNPG